jgi:hypothetical protein
MQDNHSLPVVAARVFAARADAPAAIDQIEPLTPGDIALVVRKGAGARRSRSQRPRRDAHGGGGGEARRERAKDRVLRTASRSMRLNEQAMTTVPDSHVDVSWLRSSKC